MRVRGDRPTCYGPAAYLGLVPSEHSSGQRRRLDAINKTGDARAHGALIEAVWSYRFPARIARAKLPAIEVVPDTVRQVAWKADQAISVRPADDRHRCRARTGRLRLGRRAAARCHRVARAYSSSFHGGGRDWSGRPSALGMEPNFRSKTEAGPRRIRVVSHPVV
jgi:hypothetical protein